MKVTKETVFKACKHLQRCLHNKGKSWREIMVVQLCSKNEVKIPSWNPRTENRADSANYYLFFINYYY